MSQKKIKALIISSILTLISFTTIYPCVGILNESSMRSLAIKIVILYRKLDVMNRNFEIFSSKEHSAFADSIQYFKEFSFLSNADSNFIKRIIIKSQYNTIKYGFREYSVLLTPKYAVNEKKYNMAIDTCGGIYRLSGFDQSDFYKLIKNVFGKVKNITEAKLIAKWYFSFQNLNEAFSKKKDLPLIDKRLRKYLIPIKVVKYRNNYVLRDYTIETIRTIKYDASAGSENSLSGKVLIKRVQFKINKETLKISTKEVLTRTIILKNAPKDAFEIDYIN